MKKLLICIAVILLGQFANGCGLIFPAKTLDGSEQFSAAHPELNNTPGYMQSDPVPAQ